MDMLTLGFDIGGTFTDLALFDSETGDIRVTKVPSVAADPVASVTAGLKEIGIERASRIDTVVHGTTVTTNALIQRRGARTAVVTTEGFRDLIEIGRTMRMVPGLFNTKFVLADPLVPRELRLEVGERVRSSGDVLRPLQQADIERICVEAKRLGVEAIAVCLINSYRSPEHEQTLARELGAALPDTYVVSSSDVMAEFREYERFNTTAVNAFLGPMLARYLRNLADGLRGLGYAHPLYVMSSSGGILTVAGAASHAERTLLSGPVGGVNATLKLGQNIGVENLITCDMGGTSTDVCLINGLRASDSTQSLIGGVTFKAVHVDIHTVGAGGGSIARCDTSGVFAVGPESAGAQPGPACYGNGGTEPTVTDANLLLGRLGSGGLIGGRMKLDTAAASAAIARLGEAIGISDVNRVAQGVIDLAVAKMAGAVREISVHRGQDPREYALVCFGGAGPMHAVEIAIELGIRDVIIPRHPGNFSALGLLSSDLRHDYVKTHLARLEAIDAAQLWSLLADLDAQGREQLAAEGVPEHRMDMLYSADLRYAGQGSELVLPVRKGAAGTDLAADFHAAHQQTYGHSRPTHPVELVNVRVAAIGRMEAPPAASRPTKETQSPESRRSVYFAGRMQSSAILQRAGLQSGASVNGPAIIEEFGSTTVLPPGWACRVDDAGNLRLTPGRS